MENKLEQLSNEQATSLEEKKQIEYIVSATLSGSNWVHTPEDYARTVKMATDKEILEKAEYFEITGHENGVQVVPYEIANGGAIKVHSLFVNYFKNTKQEIAGETKCTQ